MDIIGCTHNRELVKKITPNTCIIMCITENLINKRDVNNSKKGGRNNYSYENLRRLCS